MPFSTKWRRAHCLSVEKARSDLQSHTRRGSHACPLRLNPGVPPKLEDIINRALEKDRELRYQSAKEMRSSCSLKRDTETGKTMRRSVVPAPMRRNHRGGAARLPSSERFPVYWRSKLHIIGCADCDSHISRGGPQLCRRQIRSVFRNHLPLHRHALVGKPHPKLGLGNGNVDKAQPIQGPGMQLDMVRLGIAVYQQQQKERTIPTRAENECLVMLRVIFGPGSRTMSGPCNPFSSCPISCQ